MNIDTNQLRALGPTNAGPITTAFAGTLKSIDKDWVCLSLDEKHEFWIPVTSIQFIQFGPPKA